MVGDKAKITKKNVHNRLVICAMVIIEMGAGRGDGGGGAVFCKMHRQTL